MFRAAFPLDVRSLYLYANHQRSRSGPSPPAPRFQGAPTSPSPGSQRKTAPSSPPSPLKKGALKGWKAKEVGTAKNGGFTFTLRGIPAGGPYRLVLQVGKEKLTVPSFFVGDVWVLAGQSNMEGVGNKTGAAKSHPLIRCFSMRHEWRLATEPLHVLAESPDFCHHEHQPGAVQATREAAEEMRRANLKGVGPGLFFAHEMLAKSKVPQALIATAHGGTGMNVWDPAKPNSMYASMLASIRATGQPVAGVLWYQGESDASEAEFPLYVERMKNLVAATRRDLHQPKLPWVIVQISRVTDPSTDPWWNKVQEAQRLLPGQIENLEMVAAVDLALDDGIHISAEAYPLLARRLAYVAQQWLSGGKKRPPQLEKITRAKTIYGDHQVEVTFSSVEGGLRAPGQPFGFNIIRPDGVAIYPYRCDLKGNTVRLLMWEEPNNHTLHYGLGRFPYCNITDGRGFSLPVFGPLPIPATAQT